MAISAPMQPSTWNQRSSSAARSASACRSSIAPVLTVPAVPITQAGLNPAARSSAIGVAQGGDVDAQVGIGRNAPQRPIAEAQRLHRLAMAAVDLVRAIEAQGLRDGGDAMFAHVDAGLGVARHGQPDDVRHRAAADQRAAGGGGKAQHLLAPVDHLLVQQRGGMVAAAEVGTLDRRQEIAERAGKVARPHVPGPEARMDVAHRIGHHLLRDLADRRRRAARAIAARAPSKNALTSAGISCHTGRSRTSRR